MRALAEVDDAPNGEGEAGGREESRPRESVLVQFLDIRVEATGQRDGDEVDQKAGGLQAERTLRRCRVWEEGIVDAKNRTGKDDCGTGDRSGSVAAVDSIMIL